MIHIALEMNNNFCEENIKFSLKEVKFGQYLGQIG